MKPKTHKRMVHRRLRVISGHAYRAKVTQALEAEGMSHSKASLVAKRFKHSIQAGHKNYEGSTVAKSLAASPQPHAAFASCIQRYTNETENA